MEYLWYEFTSNKWGVPLIIIGVVLCVSLLYVFYSNKESK